MGVKVSQSQFDRLSSQMEREFGKIRRGEEEAHTMMLFPMESNMLKVHRKYPESNSRRALEAVTLALFEIQSYLTDDEYDLEKFRSQENGRLEEALLQAFDPFTNEGARKVLVKASYDLGNTEALRELFEEPVRCLLKIRDSIEFWCKKMGADGYFQFLENTVGEAVKRDQKMDFCVSVQDVEMPKEFHLFGRKR